MSQDSLTTLQDTRDLCEEIWKLEKKYNLLDWQVDGVYVWQALRMQIYYTVSSSAGVLEKNTNWSKKKKKARFSFGALKPLISSKPFKKINQKNLVFAFGRFVEKDGRTYDPYIDSLVTEFEKEDSCIVVEEPLPTGFHLLASYKNHIEFKALSALKRIKLLSRYFQPKWDKESINLVLSLGKELNESFNLSEDWQKYFHEHLIEFKFRCAVYKRFFKTYQPENVYIVCGYFKAPLISAAKIQKIKVIELQHGTTSQYHLGYSFPERNNPLEYFPDIFYSWGKFWQDITPFPPAEIQNVGNPVFRASSKEVLSQDKEPDSIVIISQTVISTSLSEIISKHVNSFGNYKVIYKLHPFEYEKSEQNEHLKKILQNKNVSIARDLDLFQLLAETEIVIGVFSTALYEAAALGCKLVLVDLPGLEYMQPMIDQYKIPILDEKSNFSEAMENARAIPCSELF